jgi:hypothetical protein
VRGLRPTDRSSGIHFPGNAQSLRTKTSAKENLMLDIVMLALGLGFFVVGIGYAYACERL